jgi:hypothetical protein
MSAMIYVGEKQYPNLAPPYERDHEGRPLQTTIYCDNPETASYRSLEKPWELEVVGLRPGWAHFRVEFTDAVGARVSSEAFSVNVIEEDTPVYKLSDHVGLEVTPVEVSSGKESPIVKPKKKRVAPRKGKARRT